MDVHDAGSVTVVSAVQSANALSGISVIEVALRSMLVKVVHPANAPSAMEAMDAGAVTDVGDSWPVITPSRIITPDVAVEAERNVSNVNVADDPPPG